MRIKVKLLSVCLILVLIVFWLGTVTASAGMAWAG
jgi:hypothetical protein